MDVESLLRRFLGDNDVSTFRIRLNDENRVVLSVGAALEFVVVESKLIPWTPQTPGTPAKPPPQVVGAGGFDDHKPMGATPEWTPTSFSTSFGAFSSLPMSLQPLKFG